METNDKIQGYYNLFPPKEYNVKIETTLGDALRRTLVVTRDFKAGETVYKELPVIAALDHDLQSAGSHCSHCLRNIEPGAAIEPPQDPLSASFCSQKCLSRAQQQYHTFLFSLDRPVPELVSPEPVTTEHLEARRKAQSVYVNLIQESGKIIPQLVARLIARQLTTEFDTLVASSKPGDEDFTTAEGGEYSLGDHIERLRYIEADPPTEEFESCAGLFQSALPAMTSFLNDERYSLLTGKIMYNAFGVCFDGGRSDRPASPVRPEDLERTRTPHGTERQIGAAFYTLSSYLNHSCVPSAKPSFNKGTAELHLIASRDLKEGDELTVAFIDVLQHEGESSLDCRRRRRIELARGWKFACPCPRCEEELKATPSKELEEVSLSFDHTLLEPTVVQLEARGDATAIDL